MMFRSQTPATQTQASATGARRFGYLTVGSGSPRFPGKISYFDPYGKRIEFDDIALR